MKTTPILFSGPMVRAILAGRKTQTRRVIKPQPNDDGLADDSEPAEYGYAWRGTDGSQRQCPFGQRGDALWVRETWHTDNPEYIARYKAEPWMGEPDPDNAKICYRADPVHEDSGCIWKPSIFMPRWASRITLEITGVRVERLQEISEDDAQAEGCVGPVSKETAWETGLTPRQAYRRLWDSLNANRGFGWSANPWVWVLDFRRAR